MTALRFIAGESIRAGNAVYVKEETGYIRKCNFGEHQFFTVLRNYKKGDTIVCTIPDQTPHLVPTIHQLHYIAELEAAANKAVEELEAAADKALEALERG